MDQKPNPTSGTARGEVHDRRVTPRGVLPRRVQTWIMAGLALLIITVIVLTGHQEPPPQAQAMAAAEPLPPQPERIQTFQREIADRPVVPDTSMSVAPDAGALPVSQAPNGAATPPSDPNGDERRRREYQSLFADNVAFSRRTGTSTSTASPSSDGLPPFALPTPQDVATLQRSLLQMQAPQAAQPLAPESARQASVPPLAAPAPQDNRVPGTAGQRVLEATFIETVLLNRLDGTFAGPVTSLVTTPIYSEDRQALLIPAGARLLGEAERVQNWGDTRLAVRFHRLLLPNGETFSLDQFRGLNQIGETGLKDSVNRHYLQVFGASAAIGALSGLAQWGTRGSYDRDFGDTSRQSAGGGLAASAGRVLDRYLNVLPTVTIREGHRIKVYLTNDLYLPAYAAVRPEEVRPGGVS
jgi:type IV secretion system protein TrbI